MASLSLNDRLLAGVQNMLTKRGHTGQLEPLESKIGHIYATNTAPTVMLFIPTISDGDIEKIKNEQVNYLYFMMEQHKCHHAIVPYAAMASQASEILKTHAVFKVELFLYKHLLFDPTAHALVPPHTMVPVEEVKEELGKLVKPADLARISASDAIVRFYGWKIGSVIRIKRPEGVSYRIVAKE